MADEFLILGQITAPWGNKGDVKVFLLTDFPDRFFDLEEVIWVKDEIKKNLIIDRVRKHKGMMVVKFAGIDSTNESEFLRQGYLCIPKEERIPLPEGQYYFYEIIGLTVFNSAGEKVGVVRDILTTGSNDVYVIQRNLGEKDLLLPALKSVVRAIDVQTKRMVVDIPEGLE